MLDCRGKRSIDLNCNGKIDQGEPPLSGVDDNSNRWQQYLYCNHRKRWVVQHPGAPGYLHTYRTSQARLYAINAIGWAVHRHDCTRTSLAIRLPQLHSTVTVRYYRRNLGSIAPAANSRFRFSQSLTPRGHADSVVALGRDDGEHHELHRLQCLISQSIRTDKWHHYCSRQPVPTAR